MNRQLAQREEDAAEEEAEQGQLRGHPEPPHAACSCPRPPSLSWPSGSASLSAAPWVLVGDHA